MTNGNKLMLIYMLIQSIYYRISTSCQEDLMKELTEEENLKTEDTRELMASLDKKQKELTEYQTNAVNIKKYASDLQTCLALKRIEKDVETHDTCLHSLINSEHLNLFLYKLFNAGGYSLQTVVYLV